MFECPSNEHFFVRNHNCNEMVFEAVTVHKYLLDYLIFGINLFKAGGANVLSV